MLRMTDVRACHAERSEASQRAGYAQPGRFLYSPLRSHQVQSSMMDHDRLFKELISTFFLEFVQLFLPDVAAYLDAASIEFLDKEIFTDVTAGEKHEVDLL